MSGHNQQSEHDLYDDLEDVRMTHIFISEFNFAILLCNIVPVVDLIYSERLYSKRWN